MNTMTPRTKLIVTAAVGAFILIALISLIVHFLTTGKINITTSSDETYITLRRLPPNGENINTKGAKGKFSKRVPTGTYSVTVRQGTSTAQQIFVLGSNETKNITLNPTVAGPVEQVADVGASALVADGNNIRFINRNSNTLYEINAQNQLKNISGSVSFNVIRWADASYGVGRDAKGKLYHIKGASITPLAAPFITTSATTTLAVAPDHVVYLSDGTNVYTGKDGQAFKLIHTSKMNVSVAAASRQGVLLRETDPKKERAEGELVVIDRSGKITSIEGEAYDAAWSPSGDRLLINGDERTAVLDKNLKEITRLPAGNVGAPIWLNDTQILYGLTNNLWRFDSDTGQADAIANMRTETVAQQFLDQDSSYIYITTQDSKTGRRLRLSRLGLKGQPAATIPTQLGVLLPNTLGNCSLALVNFTRPTVAVSGPIGQNAACLQKAQAYLTTYKVNQSGLGFNYTPY